MLGESESELGSEDDDAGEESHEEQAGGGEPGFGGGGVISDMTEQDLVNLRRTIYLTVMSSAAVDECAHKLMKLKLRPGQEGEVATMIIECCAQERTYLRFYGLLAERFCLIDRAYQVKPGRFACTPTCLSC